MKHVLLLSLLVIACAASADSTQAPPSTFFPLRIPKVYDKANVLQHKDYNVWGTNVLRDEDGRYHAIYSRWPKTRGHHGWVTHSEIAHAVSDNLTGPYAFKSQVLPPRGDNYWDGDCTHNPHVIEADGKYYLYYMGNRGSGYWGATPATRMPSTGDEEWWVNRNNQRIGVAVAEDLDGPWERCEEPLINVENGRRMVSTPVVSVRPDGKYLMAYKYVEDKEGLKGGRVIHVTALSDAPDGPFVDTAVPFITHPTAQFAIDDHVEWAQDGRYYCIAKDYYGSWTNNPHGSMLGFCSNQEGLNWSVAKDPLLIRAGEVKWADGTSTLCERTADMPKLYVEDGVVKAVIIAVLPRESEDSFAVIVPL